MTETTSAHTSAGHIAPVPRIRGAGALRVLAELGFAAIAAGVIARRPLVMAGLERVQADSTALKCARRLREQYGSGPVELVLPGRRILVILDPADVQRVLEESPDPFNPATREKKAALNPFQPHAVLISEGHLREQRRLVNVAALDTPRELHRMAGTIADVADQEADVLLSQMTKAGSMSADDLLIAWWKAVRRITFGDAARDDEQTTDLLRKLRAAGNWSFLSRPHPMRRERFIERLYQYVADPAPGSLAAALGEIPTTPAVDPIGQMPHWLFAFDAAGIAMSRALALLATHPEQMQRALSEVGSDGAEPRTYDFLRDCMLESVRLWPTTPSILRDTTADTYWGDDRSMVAKAGAGVIIQAPVFHRDPELANYANTFAPDIWSDGRAAARPDLVPFSAGPARCPGENLVLFTTSTFLAHLLRGGRFTLTSTPHLSPDAPLPVTFNNFGLRFEVSASFAV
ncbi:cytochrome P450 [Williamsia muralis]|uniref:Cytochrome P450 n=1 Tax=Williamsia marianensis TaxID=85044 RepID=A0ABU4EQR8_WILMA|nr:cytochrome P450 [Williamsia muralis]MDV7132957.1 cytochrome P450 [Williamsia muralis]